MKGIIQTLGESGGLGPEYLEEQKKKEAAMQGYTPRMKAGGKVSSASKRADGCCVKGKTKGRMV
jgi:hypothetical protein